MSEKITDNSLSTSSNTFDHTKIEIASFKYSENNELTLDLPIKNVSESILPGVTVMVVTRNRKEFADIIIDNWKRIKYPADKLQLLIIDDSDQQSMGPVEALRSLKDKRISYCYVEPKKDGVHSIGTKRNHGVSLAKYDYICNMDDDDFLYDDSILARMLTLLSYKKQCVYSDSIGVFNTKFESTYIVENLNIVPPGSMLFSKVFWMDKKFDETNFNEANSMVQGKETDMVRIPWFFSYVSLFHKSNKTQIAKSVIKIGKNKNNSLNPTMNLWKTAFSKPFKDAVKKIM
jgi:glycosyltransferase involved in cell wall biosynthesis